MTLKKLLLRRPGNIQEFLDEARGKDQNKLKLEVEVLRKPLEDDLGVPPSDMDILGEYKGRIWLSYGSDPKRRERFMAAKVSNTNGFIEYTASNPETGSERHVGFEERLFSARDNILTIVKTSGFEAEDATDYTLDVYSTLHRI